MTQACSPLDEILDAPLELPQRGLPSSAGTATLTIRAMRSLSLNVTRGDVLLPAMVLKESALANNLRVMADFSRERGLCLAPHGKTTMAPQLFRRQLDRGAWGITVANVAQAEVARRAGAERILIANEVVGRAEVAELARWLAAGAPEVLCLVDSVAAVNLLGRALDRAGTTGRLPVLLEIGASGGRTGARTKQEVLDVAAAIRTAARLQLVGLEGYEGVLGLDRDATTLARVDDFLMTLRSMTTALADAGAFDGAGRVIVSAGGGTYFDRIADVLAGSSRSGENVDVVLRPGCYISHDHGHYAEVSPLAQPDARGRRLIPALEIWAAVLSVPERSRAIVGMGKRDVSFDLGLPIPLHIARDSDNGTVSHAPSGVTVTRLDDQHAYLDMSAGSLAVGDRLGFGLSHPCAAFDRWRLLLVVDDDYTVIDGVRTYF